MPRKSKANRQLASARVKAAAAKIARTDIDYAPDVEFLDNTPSTAAVPDEEADSAFFIDGIHWRILPEEPSDSQQHDDEDKMNINLQDDEVALRMTESIDAKWRAVGDNFGYHGTSRSSFYRKAAETALRCESVEGDRKISSFYHKVEKAVVTERTLTEEIATCSSLLKKECKREAPIHKYSVIEAMERLKPLVMNSRASSSTCNQSKPWEVNRARAVFKYFTLLLEDKGKLAASAETALAFYPLKGHGSTAVVRSADESKTCYKARSVREWGEEYLVTGEFPEFKQGEHSKTFSIINNEMNRAELTAQLRSWSDVERTPDILLQRCNAPDGLLSKMNQAPSQISYSTAKRWMIELGFKPVTASKGWFTDAHERVDVIASREIFLTEMLELERRMCHYEGENMDTRIEPDLLVGENEVVLITHDESTFYCNEGRRFFWLENGKKKLLPKSKGTSLMVSGFCCQCHGFMSLSTGKSYQLFKAGTGREGWFTNQHLVDQFNCCLHVLKHYHPACDLVIAFDNSMTHRARAPDGLDASRLNKGDGGKNVPLMRNGFFIDSEGVRHEQSMRNEKGEQLGLLSILKARGRKDLSIGGHELNKQCHGCRLGLTTDVVGEKCCLSKVLSEEPDFMMQKEWLTEVVELGGCEIIFYPKYHCELNFIEMIWGWLKSYHRRSCTYNFKHLEETLPVSIDETMPIAFVRRASRHCMRFMTGYREGLTGPLLQFAVQKYKSHRAIPAFVIDGISKEYNDRKR